MTDPAASSRVPHPARCARILLRQLSAPARPVTELVDAIVNHCGHSRLRAHRLAHGWTLAELISHMTAVTGAGERLDTSRVSRWERRDEQPSARYQDALCRVYQTSPVELGLSADYSIDRRPGAADDARTVVSAAVAVPRQRPEHDDTAPTEPASARPAVERAERVRRRVDEALSTSTVSDATIDYKAGVAQQYGRTYKTEPVATFLPDILADLEDVQVLTDRKLPSGQRQELCAVTARLAGLVSMVMVNIGRYRQAREWVHTARLAADEAGDPQLRAWVATRGAVASLHLGDPQAAATAAREAEMLTHRKPGDITAMAWAIVSRAAATMHDPRAARVALHRAENLFPSDDTAHNTAFVFTPGQLHFYRSHTLTTIGETSAAWQAQDDALAAFDPDERLDPVLVHLDRAVCMVTDGDTTRGSTYATTTLLSLPAEYRPAIIVRRARAIAAAVPAQQRSAPAVRSLYEALAIELAR